MPITAELFSNWVKWIERNFERNLYGPLIHSVVFLLYFYNNKGRGEMDLAAIIQTETF